MKLEELKEKFEKEIKRFSNKGQSDYFLRFLMEDHISDIKYKNMLKTININKLDLFEVDEITDSFIENSKNVVDDILSLEWKKHQIGYWEDKLKLLELYTSPLRRSNLNLNPMTIYNELNSLKIKIERRLLIIDFKYSKSEQKHSLSDGTKKNYNIIRGYWIHDDGFKRRSISKNVSFDESVIDDVIRRSFHNSDYTIYPKKRNNIWIVGYGDSKYAVKINFKENVNEDDFFRIVYFNELVNMFNKIYKQ